MLRPPAAIAQAPTTAPAASVTVRLRRRWRGGVGGGLWRLMAVLPPEGFSGYLCGGTCTGAGSDAVGRRGDAPSDGRHDEPRPGHVRRRSSPRRHQATACLEAAPPRRHGRATEGMTDGDVALGCRGCILERSRVWCAVLGGLAMGPLPLVEGDGRPRPPLSPRGRSR